MNNTNLSQISSCMIMLNPHDGIMIDCSDTAYPSVISSIGYASRELVLDSHSMHTGYLVSGSARLHCSEGDFEIHASMSFGISGGATLHPSEDGRGFIMSRIGKRGTFQLCGSMDSEDPGLLDYIDNASTNLLILPRCEGDPCLNKLVFPAQQIQTPHTHDSFRMTCVVSGSGFCEVPDQGRVDIHAGDYFLIPEHRQHAINTTDERLVVVTAHPTSIGPGNPMRESTFLV